MRKLLIILVALVAVPALAAWTTVRFDTNTLAVEPPSFPVSSGAWSSNAAVSDLDMNSYNIDNCVTGEFTALTLNGVTITNWSTPTPLPPTPGQGTVTHEFEYGGLGLWATGTVYVYAWDNADMFGLPIWSTNFYTANLANDPSYSFFTPSTLVGSTYWYAYMDVDNDATFNLYTNGSSSGGLGLEPGCMAEHNPQIIASISNSLTVKFVMVDQKGMTWRFGWQPTGNDPRKRIVIDTLSPTAEAWRYGQAGVLNNNWIGQSHRRFWCEVDFLENHKTGGAAATCQSAGYTWDSNKNVNLEQFYYPATDGTYVEMNAPSKGYFVVTGGGTAYPVTPTNGATVSSQTVELGWTNAYQRFTGLNVQIFQGDTNPVGSLVYYYSGYQENEHANGRTHHLVRPETGGPTFLSTSNYYWRVRSVFGVTNTAPRAWSAYGNFTFQ